MTEPRARRWKLPIEVIALLAIAVFVIATRIRYIRHGMCFDDPTWYFHFGRRILEGDVPYRDFVFQVGALPLYVDALAQWVFGSIYAASLYAAVAVVIARVFVTWLLIRRLAGTGAASVLAVYCALDPTFSLQAHHWSTQYAALFITLAGYGFVRAVQATGRGVERNLVLAGAMMALVITTRQSAAMMMALAGFGTAAVLWVRGEFFDRRRFAALAIGYAGCLVVVALLLASQGALGAAIQQMFLDAPAKKGVHGTAAVLDAISGGALVAGDGFRWWSGFLMYLGVPAAVSAAILWLGSRRDPISPGHVAMAVMPVALLVGLATRYATLGWFTDLPRTFLTVAISLAVLSPDRLRRWTGLEPLLVVGLGALPLASDFALEMSFPGRGWGDLPALVSGALVLCLATPRLSQRTKLTLCAGFAVMGMVHVAVCLRARINPFAQADSIDGSMRESKYAVAHPMLEGMRVTRNRRAGLTWLVATVPPGSTCFVYGNMPVLYSLLGCTNPTQLDSTAGDFITAADANRATAILRANPPEFIVTQERAWMNPPLTDDPSVANYTGLNPPASRAIHGGLRALIDRYESLGTAGEAMGPELAALSAIQRDHLDTVRIYRRKPAP